MAYIFFFTLAGVGYAGDACSNLDIGQLGRLVHLPNGVDAGAVDVTEGEVVQ